MQCPESLAEMPIGSDGQKLDPLQTEPAPDTIAIDGPTQGGLLLFRIGSSAYANRPLTLHILSPQNVPLASISLDL